MTKLIHYSYLLLFICLSGCNKDLIASSDSKTSSTNFTKGEDLPANNNISLKNINFLGFDLFKSLDRSNENLFFSPYCVASSFAFLYPGSRGETKTEIQRFFHFSTNSQENSRFFNTLNTAIINMPDSAGQVNIANALWVQNEYKIVPDFLQQTKNYFNSELYLQDFINNPQKSCDTINKWVSEKTNHKIENIISANDITKATRSILTSSIYFNRLWSKKFDKDLTQYLIFYNSDKTESTVKIMNIETQFNYGEDSLLQVLEIPYVGNYSMIVLLPKSIQNGLKDIELSYSNYQKWTSSMSFKEVVLSMPKFKFKNTIQLSDILTKMGLTTSFTPMADFRGISKENTFINKCYQYSYIAVNEERTEAAAVGLTFSDSSSAIGESPPEIFNMNHPFVFLILSKKSNTILFLGKVNEFKNEKYDDDNIY